MGLVFENVVGIVEIINCRDVKIQVCVLALLHFMMSPSVSPAAPASRSLPVVFPAAPASRSLPVVFPAAPASRSLPVVFPGHG